MYDDGGAYFDHVHTPVGIPADEASCRQMINKASDEVGPHNVYNIYDNCPRGRALKEALAESGKSMRWLLREMRVRQGFVLSLGGRAGRDAVTAATARRRRHRRQRPICCHRPRSCCCERPV